MNDELQEFLNSLSPEQLRKMADLKESSSEPKSKRKQSRKKISTPDENVSTNQPKRKNGPQRKKRRKKKSTLDKILDQKGNPCKRLGTTPVGNRPNRFEDWPERNSCTEDIELDKILNKNRKPSPRLKPERQPQFVDAVCSKCDDEFENVSIGSCYKDGSIYVFVCGDCIRSKT